MPKEIAIRLALPMNFGLCPYPSSGNHLSVRWIATIARLGMLRRTPTWRMFIMGAVTRTLNVYPSFGFTIPVPEPLLGRVAAWFEQNANLGGMVLMEGEARFREADRADAFADEIGAAWNVRD